MAGSEQNTGKPAQDELFKAIPEALELDSYRVEKKATMKVALADKDAEM
jgi:type I restriction enzyme, R subunit